ncbi:hypothetical protein CQY20_11190 [Mycolicibacterium agri]|nr:hypothetical protein [Mycolicibacterium agri]PEG39183.1 hypothetical protein CQY20_11190 [Mycolicibacterium agri]
MRLDRRWWVAIAVVVVVLVALGVSQTGLFGRSSQECAPVKDMLAFNREQSQQIESKFGDAEGVPTPAEDIAYQAWADGLAERAGKITAPDLAGTATQLAYLANEFVGTLPEIRAQSASRAPGAPAPPAAYEAMALNGQILEKIKALADACK